MNGRMSKLIRARAESMVELPKYGTPAEGEVARHTKLIARKIKKSYKRGYINAADISFKQ